MIIRWREKDYTRAVKVPGGYILTTAQADVPEAEVIDAVERSIATPYSWSQYPYNTLEEGAVIIEEPVEEKKDSPEVEEAK